MTDDLNGREKVADKIRKLLALGTSPNEHEAAAAVAKAQALMFQYNLHLDDLVERRASEIGERQTEINLLLTWHIRLAYAVTESSLCTLFVINKSRVIGGRYTAKKDKYLVLVGRDHDTEVAELTLSWLMGELNRLSNEYAATLETTDDYEWTPAARKVARRSWLEGAAVSVGSRLREEFNARREADSASTALVVHRTADLTEYMEKKKLGKAKKTYTARKHDSEAFLNGVIAGKTVALRPGEQEPCPYHVGPRKCTAGPKGHAGPHEWPKAIVGG